MDKREKLDALKLALTNEEKEKEFYLQHAGRTSNEVGKKMFIAIAKDEEEHYRKIEELYNNLKERDGWPDGFSSQISSSKVAEIIDDIIQKSLVSESADVEDEKAVEMAIDFERMAEEFYSELAERADSEEERNFFNMLSSLEREHRLSLEDTLDYFKDPQGWLERKGGRHLDGA